ncbi:monooxygenase FAD-binding protein [Hyaloraphidium curvatum]|nr:monooxygenase FAD-binding protein [Hyaloraphidium curvatum]
MNERTSVLIVGAGPVGLLLANLLARSAVPHTIVDRRSSRNEFCKALGITPRTLEIFDQLGILNDALDRGLFFRALNTVVDGKRVSRLEVPPAGPDGLPYGAFSLSQYEAERVLEASLVEHGGGVQYGTEVVSLEQQGDSVTCVLADGTTISAQFVVGCDGAHSIVRKLLGIPFEGGRFEPKFMLGDVELDWEDREHADAWKIIRKDFGLCVAIPIFGNPKRYRVSMQAPRDLWEEETGSSPPTVDQLRQKLPPDLNIVSARWTSFYKISHRLVPRYRDRRVLLAGDAAHIHPPIGGLGMNTGLQDAHNLAWKLVSVLRGHGGETLLESYHNERHAVGLDVVGLTSARMDGKSEPDAAEAARKDTQLFISYAGLGFLSAGRIPEGHRGAQPGDRLDSIDELKRPGTMGQVRLVELMRYPNWTLMCYGGALPCPGLALRHLAYVVGKDPPEEEVPWIHDAAGRAEETWGKEAGWILVRPDGIVGWRGTPADKAQLEKYVAGLSSLAPL